MPHYVFYTWNLSKHRSLQNYFYLTVIANGNFMTMCSTSASKKSVLLDSLKKKKKNTTWLINMSEVLSVHVPCTKFSQIPEFTNIMEIHFFALKLY